MAPTELQLAWLMADVEHLQRITAMQAQALKSFATRLSALSAATEDTLPQGVVLPPPCVEPLAEPELSLREPYEVKVRLLTSEERAQRQVESDAKAAQYRAEEAVRRERIRGKPHVYFIQQGDSGAIKIGCSKNPSERLRCLQTGHSEALRLLTCAVGSQAQERALHDRFAHLRVSGEWFRPADDLLAYIRLVNDRRAL